MQTHGRKIRVKIDGITVAYCSTKTQALRLKALFEDVSEGFHERNIGVGKGGKETYTGPASGDGPPAPSEIPEQE